MGFNTAFTITDISGAKVRETGTSWRINASSNDINTCEILVDAPGVGHHIYLESLTVIFVDDIIVSIGAGESSSAVEKRLLGLLSESAWFDFSYDPIVLPDNKALTADSSEAGLVCIVAKGFTI